MFPKKLSINPNKNSTKVIKGKEKTFWWDIKKKKKKTQNQNTNYTTTKCIFSDEN